MSVLSFLCKTLLFSLRDIGDKTRIKNHPWRKFACLPFRTYRAMNPYPWQSPNCVKNVPCDVIKMRDMRREVGKKTSKKIWIFPHFYDVTWNIFDTIWALSLPPIYKLFKNKGKGIVCLTPCGAPNWRGYPVPIIT